MYAMSDRAFEVLESIEGVKPDYCFMYEEGGTYNQRRGYSPYMVGKIIEYFLDTKDKNKLNSKALF